MNCYQAMNAWSFRRFFRIIQHVYLLTVLALRRIYFKQNTPSVPLQPAAVPPPFWKCGVYMHPPPVAQPNLPSPPPFWKAGTTVSVRPSRWQEGFKIYH